ncbi:MAG: serine/threonine protein kinase [Myxococcaceae bacterium]|jgi:serine/threonine protein kinase|nr:serine/threonine protein kinase [Myxococcaceae bacterium]
MPLEPGTPVGEYEVGPLLGAGGMGEVYEAVHPIIGKRVAIKVMRAPAAEALTEARRLLEEARTVNAIRHRGIVDIFGANVLPDGRPYLVMELLEGTSLHQQLVTHGPTSILDGVELLRGVLEPLAAAHRVGVVHRDLKPTNVFVTTSTPRVKLLDFGIAHRAGRERLTSPEFTLGSIGFMGPEQLSGKPVPQSDLYAIGCVAWLMFAGRPVFASKSIASLTRDHLFAEPPSLKTARRDVPDGLATWVSRLLEKHPSNRPADAAVALAQLDDVHLDVESRTPTLLDLPPVADLPPAIDEVSTRPHALATQQARGSVTTVPGLSTQARRTQPHETLGDDGEAELTVSTTPRGGKR